MFMVMEEDLGEGKALVFSISLTNFFLIFPHLFYLFFFPSLIISIFLLSSPFILFYSFLFFLIPLYLHHGKLGMPSIGF